MNIRTIRNWDRHIWAPPQIYATRRRAIWRRFSARTGARIADVWTCPDINFARMSKPHIGPAILTGTNFHPECEFRCKHEDNGGSVRLFSERRRGVSWGGVGRDYPTPFASQPFTSGNVQTERRRPGRVNLPLTIAGPPPGPSPQW